MTLNFRDGSIGDYVKENIEEGYITESNEIEIFLNRLENKYNFMRRINPDLDYGWQAIIHRNKMEQEDKEKVIELFGRMYQQDWEGYLEWSGSSERLF